MAAYQGEIYALAAALFWAIASLMFHRAQVSAAALNFYKNVIGTALLVATLWWLAQRGQDSAIFHWDATAWGWLALSSVVGIAVGDTCYFRSLQILGPRRALILTTVAPPAAVLLGWWFLDETQSLVGVIGIAVTLAGVAWVVRERGAEKEAAGHFPGSVLLGSIYGIIGALCQSIGAIWSKQGLVLLQPLTTNAAMEATFVRLLVAAGFGLLVGLVGRRLRRWAAQILRRRTLLLITPAAFIGTYMGIWFSLLAFEHTSVGIATTLTSTSPVFVLPLVWLVLRQRVSPRAIGGALVAIAGVVLLFRADALLAWLSG